MDIAIIDKVADILFYGIRKSEQRYRGEIAVFHIVNDNTFHPIELECFHAILHLSALFDRFIDNGIASSLTLMITIKATKSLQVYSFREEHGFHMILSFWLVKLPARPYTSGDFLVLDFHIEIHQSFTIQDNSIITEINITQHARYLDILVIADLDIGQGYARYFQT